MRFETAFRRDGQTERGKKERRIFQEKVQLRAADEAKTIFGHAAVFNREADLGWFREVIKPGAFKKTIAENDIRCLFNHDSNLILGRSIKGSGNLSLSEDDIGLAFACASGTRSYEMDLRESIERGDVSQCSIGFYVREWTTTAPATDADTWLRTITEIELLDVSPVTFPAYVETDVSCRSLKDTFEEFSARSEKNPTQSQIDEVIRDLERRRRVLQLMAIE
jgi:HK97 family phage prohead protease